MNFPEKDCWFCGSARRSQCSPVSGRNLGS